jgi:hypothetical protein
VRGERVGSRRAHGGMAFGCRRRFSDSDVGLQHDDCASRRRGIGTRLTTPTTTVNVLQHALHSGTVSHLIKRALDTHHCIGTI